MVVRIRDSCRYLLCVILAVIVIDSRPINIMIKKVTATPSISELIVGRSNSTMFSVWFMARYRHYQLLTTEHYKTAKIRNTKYVIPYD